ncbi:MAG: biotin/lipoyl-binding protein, partial [Anaerolineales bacterium]
MRQRARFIPLVVIILAIVIGTGWWVASLRADLGLLMASGTIEAVEVVIGPEQGGRVVSVLVDAGDAVHAGQPLVELDAELLRAQLAQAEANLQVAQASYDLLAAGASAEDLALAEAGLAAAMANPENVLAQQAYDDLFEKYDLSAASAKSALASSEQRREDAQEQLDSVVQPDFEYYQDRVDDAREALLIAQQNQELTGIGVVSGAYDRALQNFQDFEDILRQVQDQIAKCVPDTDGDGVEDRNCDPNRAITVDGRPWTLADAQEAFDDAAHLLRQAEIQVEQSGIGDTNAIDAAQKQLDDAEENLAWALRAPDALDLAQAQADLAVAEAALAQAQADWEAVRDGPEPDALAVAEARVAFSQANVRAAQAQVDLVAAPPRADQLAMAAAQVQAARAVTELLQLQIDRQTLAASVEGVVLNRSVEPGETVLPGAALLTIGQLDSL